MATDVGIRITATDQTKAAFDSAGNNMARLGRDADSLQSSIAGFTGKFGALGAAVTAAFTGASLKSVIDLADKIDDLAEKTGIATKELSALRYAGEVVGTPIDALATGLRKLAINMAAAAGGSKEQAAAFDAVGVSFQDGNGKLRSSSAVLGDLATKFASFKDGPEKAALAVELFGKAGADLIPLLNQGASGIEKLRDEGERLGVVMSGELARAAADFNDNLKRIGMAAEGSKLAIAAELLPTLNQLADAFIASKDGTNSLATAIGNGLRTAMEAAIVLASDVKFVLVSMGKELGAIGAQMAALIRLDFKSFSAISDAVKEDGVRARAELDKFQRDLLNSRYLNSQAGAGRGNGVDPRILGDIKTNAPIVLKETAKAAQDLTKAYDSLSAAIDKESALAEEQLTLGRALTESEKFRVSTLEQIDKALAKNNVTLDQAVELESLMTQAQLKRAQVEQFILASKASELRQQNAIKEADAIREFVSQTEAGYLASARASEDAVMAAQAEFDAYEKTKSQLAEVTLLRLQEKLEKFDSGSVGYEATQREIAAQKELIGILQKGEVREAAATAAKEAAAEWKRVSNQIEQSLTDALLRGFESGKGFISNFRDTIVNMFKTLVLRPIISAVVNPVAQSVTGALGLGGVSSAANAASGMSGLGSTVSALGAFGGAASSGLSLAMNGLASEAIAAGATMVSTATGISSALAGLGQMAGAAGPYVAAAYAAYKIITSMTSGETRSGVQLGYHAGVGIDASISPSGGAPEGANQALTATVNNINALLTSLGSKLSVAYMTGGMESSKNGNGFNYAGGILSSGQHFGTGTTGQGYLENRGSQSIEQAVAGYTLDLKKATIDALKVAADIPKSVQDYLASIDTKKLTDAAADGIIKDIAAVAQFQAAIKTLPFEQLKNVTFDAANAILNLSGGMDNFSAAAQTYYSNFYSASEQSAQATKSVSDALASMGLAMPSTREAFRAMVEAQDLNTESGQRNYSALMALSGAFAAVTPATVAATAGVAAVSSGINKMADLLSSNADLQVQLLNAQGQSEAALALQRANSIQGLDAASTAQAKANFALEDQIKAAEAAAARQTAITNERKSLQDQLDSVTLTSAQLLAKQRDALDESNRALFDQVNAAKAAAAAEAELAARQTAVANERRSLQDQLDSLTLTSAELLAKQRDALDESNRALFDQIVAAKASATAQAAAAAAQATAAAAAKQLAATNQNWSDQLAILTGRETQRSIALRDAGDDSTRAIMRQVWAQQDLQAATAQASASMQSFIDNVQGLVSQVHTSVTDSIFNMRYSVADSPGRYAMLDQQAQSLDAQMRQSTNIDQIAALAQREIDTINRAFALLNPDQQRESLAANTALLARIDAFVSASGADAVSRRAAENAQLSGAVAAAVSSALQSLAAQMTAAALASANAASAQGDAAATIAAVVREPAVVNVNVSVSKAPGTEVSVS